MTFQATIVRGDVQTSGPSETVGEKADPRQVENGHLRLANGIVADLRKLPIPFRHKEVIRAIQEKTYGWQKTVDRISLSQLDDMLGFGKPNLSRIVNDLIRWNLIIRTEDGKLGYQKHPEYWQLEDRYTIREAKRTRMLAAREKSPTTIKHRAAESSACKGLSKSEGLSESDKGLSESEKVSVNDNEKVSVNDNHKKQLEPIEVEADASTSDRLPKSASNPRRSSAPRCPHEQLVDLWAKHFPDAPQPQSISDRRKEHITSGWQHVWKIRHRRSGKPMYQHYVPEGETWTDREGGILWWDKFMGFIAEHCPFMTEKMRTFDIEWLFWPGNIDRTMDGRYSGPVQDDRGGARHGHR